MERFYVKVLVLFIFIQAVIINKVQASDSLIRIKLTGSVYSDETVIRFRNNTTTDFDFDYDAFKIMSIGTTPSMYTTIGNINYSINSIPAADSLPVIQLGTKILEESLYTMSFENSTGLHNYVLVDKKMNIKTPVDSSSTYSFFGSAEDSPDRFELQFQKPSSNERNMLSLSTQKSMEDKIRVTSCAGGIYVSLKELYADDFKIEIIRVGGKVLQTIDMTIPATASYEAFIELSDALLAGNYLATVHTGDVEAAFHIIVVK